MTALSRSRTRVPTVEEVFEPLIGKWAWQVKRGYGSFLTMEFGNPHLEVREPKLVGADVSAHVRENFRRRRVTVVGDWHLWIQYCDWQVVTANRSISSIETDNPYMVDECLAELDGQILTSARAEGRDPATVFRFDLGGMLQVSPSMDQPEEYLWTLYQRNVRTFALGADGRLHEEKAKLPER
jgi:hypothetical protein